jgi:hypothetical protein
MNNKCYIENGFFPISFSYPKNSYLYIKDQLVSNIVPKNNQVPGYKYDYDNELDYLKEYQRSYYGLTHKKAGWDCMRHLEILYSGAVPLMPDAAQIPKYTMTHHPKELYAEIYDRFEKTNEPPRESDIRIISGNFNNNLTNKAMAKYILNTINMNPKTILYVDESLPQKEDYLSMMTLIGFKQLMGTRCVEAFITPYLYDTYTPSTKTLYGQGFGYSKALPAKFISGAKGLQDINSFDLIIVGSLGRNVHLLDILEKSTVPLVYLYGEDLSPAEFGHLNLIYNSRAITFVREVY